ncbi:VirB4 family type IV secretion/conjugal transfer ATPase [Candidatus Trichorickettsia mobilis]|uniref:VirB4 family type IV secretion/conjugal transfer ATPase n=1 Tax=Candidatus Trichorickettsia mobilis TaxID=1346319 RepID=UPI002B25668C|nr:VirB4 family type IV secretion/conjugal transfer ATPase [Candidatus Trichorickettsia mobilis]
MSRSSRKSDKDLYNNVAERYIPIACHYDSHTLLTKNGELLQTIQINGINSEKISDKLFNLREMVRGAIKDNIEDKDFAFWIHTVRRKTNLDDMTPYKKLLPANIHDLWQRKNYWDDKFVNTLYISIIHDSPAISITNLSAFINSLTSKVIIDFHDRYFDDAFTRLNSTVDKLLASLEEYGAVKLGIRFEGENSFSDPMFLYRRIVHLNEDNCLTPVTDLSTALASHQYAVGGDKLEVIDEHGKKFAAMLSVKEYHEISSEALDVFLQLPIEMIATEVFYFVNKEKVTSAFTEQDNILRVSGDSDLNDIKGITQIMDVDGAFKSKFCRQQISIAIIGDDVDRLEEDIHDASQELSKIGIVHVREDINLEQTFWAQLPGNFVFLRRMTPTILQNTAALASLHNFPSGEQYNPWGRAVTLLRTEKSTPYFMNLHTKDNKVNNCIYGAAKTGKTVLTNFLISEATKYDPTILYFAHNNDSQIFIEALEGQWLETEKSLINPLLYDDTKEARAFIYEFLRIICNHYIKPLNEQEDSFLNTLVSNIFTINISNRNLSTVLKGSDFSTLGGELIKSRLEIFNEGGLFYGIFDKSETIKISSSTIMGVNLHKLGAQYFTKEFWPEDPKLVNQFTDKLQQNNSVRMGLIYALSYYFITNNNAPKILVIDGVEQVLDPKYFNNVVTDILDKVAKNNGVMSSNLNLGVLQSPEAESYKEWVKLIDTSFILPLDVRMDDAGELLGLNKAEIDKLLTFNLASRMFLVKQGAQAIAAELSIGGFIGMVRILSADTEELAVYQQILAKYPGHPDNWIDHLYEALDNIQ